MSELSDEFLEEAARDLLVDEEEDDLENAARNLDRDAASLSLQAADNVNPDDAARSRSVAKRLGAPTDFVDLDLEAAARELKINDDRDALTDRPATQGFLADPDKAKLASDDVSTLADIENYASRMGRAVTSGVLQQGASAPEGYANLAKWARTLEENLTGPTDPDSIMGQFDSARDLLMKFAGAELKAERERIQLKPEERDYFLDVLEGTGNIGTQAVVTVLNPALGLSLMTTQGADEMGETLKKINKGTKNENAVAGIAGALVTGLLEKAGIERLMKPLGLGDKVKDSAVKALTKRFASGFAIEATEETLEAAARDAIIYAIVDPDREILEDFTAYEASVAGGSGGLFRSLLGIRRSRTADDDIRNQIDKARQSKLLGRDPEAFEEFYQSLVDGTESDEVRVSVEGLVNELNQTGGDPVEFLTTLGVDLAEAQKALDNGGDISINRGKFVTEIAASEGRDDILRHVRSDDGAMTVAEAEVESAAIQERVAEAVAQFNETGEMPAAPTPEIATQAEEIGARIAEQIDASGKYTRQGSKAIGSVYEALFRTIASDYAAEGKEFDLEGIAAELGVNVRAIPFADRASPVTGDETLGGPQREPFDQETSGFPLAVGEDRQFPVEGAINSMTPDEFLDRAPPLEIDEEARETIDALKAHIQSGGRLDALIADTRTDEEKAAGVNRGREDGRHRAMAAKELGIDSVPVITPGTPQAAEQSGFEDYRDRVDPDGRTIPAEDRPNLGMGDMYGMLPQDAEVVSELDDGITIHRGPNGDYYATAINPDLGEQDVVGYIQGGDNGTELAVVQEMQGRGIGSELQYLFRSENPFAPTGGLTEAGARRLEGTYNRLYDEGVITPEDLRQAGRDLLTDANKEKAVRAANKFGDLAAYFDASALRDEALTDNGLMYEYNGELELIDIPDLDARVSDPSALIDGSILEISDITDWSDIDTLERVIDLAPSDFSSFVFTPDDFKIEVDDTGEGFAGNLKIDYNAIEDRVRQQAVQDNKVDTIEDALNHPSHMVRGAAFASILEDLGVEFGEDGSETGSRYFYVSLPAESEFEQIKVRFADHTRQSGLHQAADFNVADGGYDTAMQALDRIVAGNNLGTVFQGGTQDFQAFFEGSKVVDKNGAPLRVFRGEHGEVTGSVTTLLPSITFTDQPAEASLYAQDPNQSGLGMKPVAPRVSPAFLSIKNPIINEQRNPEIDSEIADPFIDYGVLVDAIGLEKTIDIARRINVDRPVEDTSLWDEEFSADYDSFEDLVDRAPERVGELYNIAFAVLDDPGAVEALKEAGYDGAIHGGYGGQFNTMEYRVFDESQIRSAVAPEEVFQRDKGLQDDGGHQFRISTRLPTTMRAEEDPVAENLKVDLEAMRFKPAAFKHNMELVKKYPGFSTRSRNPDKIAEEFLEFTTNNLLWLFDSVPPETRERSKLWYDGARAMSERIAEDHGIPVQSVAAVMAALSPQKDWYQNASLGERVIDIHMHFTQGNAVAFLPDNKMKATARRIFPKDKDKAQRLLVMRSTYSDLTEANDKAMWLRIYDETYNPRGFRVLSPEGEFVGEATGKVAWGSKVEIEKAVAALEDPSLENLTAIMGAKHKVRNFYNNILAPNAPAGDVTIDTHAVAAALIRALSGGSAEVHHNFGSSPGKDKQPKGWQAAKNINDNGAQGTYGIYAEAYRRAAKLRGVSPRELQSITWEAARGLFTAKFKQNSKNVAAIDAIWYDYQRGKIDLDEARNRILETADGINQPDWVDQRDTSDATLGDTSYAGELAGIRVSRRGPRRLDAGSGDPDRTGELFQEDDGGGVARLYSAARRATQSLKQEKATASQWLSHFKKSGVKDDEIMWIVGLEEFLNSQKGSISRDDVRAFVDQNGVQVRETVLDNEPPPVRKWATEVAIPLAERYLIDEGYTLEAGEAGTFILLDDFLVREGLTDAEVVEYAESLDFNIGRPPEQSRKQTPQFTQYSMDGDRENDQEFYLNLPAKLSTGNATVKDWMQPVGHRIGDFVSDTRNIIRIRTNNRTFEDGRKVLFIEEMQDDRGQAARDLGVQEMDFGAEAELADAEFAALKQDATDFLDNELENILIEELGETRDADELLTAFRDANDALEATNSRFTWEDRFAYHAELMSEDTRAAVNEYIEAALSGERLDGRMQSNRVPARPFIGSNKVLPLALKRMIIEAVEQGQDAIAWTPGDVQNDRYNLRRVVDQLRLYSNFFTNFRNVVTLHGFKDGNVRFEQDVKDVDDLSSLIGKDRAEKMFADLEVSETNESLLEGDDLEIGGEGMRKYYDQMVVAQANKLGKKFGAKVEVGQTRAGNNEREFYSEFDRPGMLREAGYTRDQYPDTDEILQITQEMIPFPEPVFAETLEAESRELEAKRMELELAIFDQMRDTDFYQRTEDNRDGFFPRKPQDFIRAIQNTVPNSVLEVEQFPGYDDLPAAQQLLISEYLEAFYQRAETDAMAAYGEEYLTRLQIDAPTDGYPLDLIIPSMGVDTNVIADRALWNQVQGALEKSQDVWTLPITDKMREAVTGPGLPLFQDPKDPLGSFNPTERVINLFEKADQSTLLHESGHAFVDILGRLVARGDAPARIVDNYNAMLNWVGAESANDLNLNINGDAAREKQELLAQAFEAYLMEGQAPSAELQGAFQMFRQWLINIYRRVRRLEVEVDPTISAVFDRMLATDNEIAEMEQVNAFDFTASPSVTSIMSDEERARHDALSAAASEAARNERVLEERAAEAREQQAWWQEEYQNALERAEAAVYERPEYKAYYFLTRGEFYNGNTPANLEGRRISKQALLDLGYTQQQLNSLPRGARRIYTTKEEAATDPELFAAYFGFADTNEMMDVFLSMRPAKDAIEFDAGTIMRSEHGDPMNDGTMERITEERLFNDERYSAIEMELNALATQTGQQAVGRRLVKAIVDRVFAEETVGGLLTPMRYQAASVRAAREAERAAAKGDFEKAFMKKRQQLLNHEMFRRSLQARDEIQKISQKMKTYQRRKYSPKQVDPEYIGEIKSFLSFFEFGQRSKSGQIKAEQAKALMDFIEARQAKGMPIILPGELVEVASLDPETGAPNVVFKTKHWRDMTMPEIRGLRDMADNLYKIGRDNSAEKKAERRARGEELADGILASTKRRRGKQDPLSIPTRDEKVKESKRSRFSAWHRKMESMLYQLDGFKNLGPMYRGVFEKLARASDVKTQLVEKARTDFDDALRLYDKDVLAKMQTAKSAVSIAALGGARLTREQRVTIALNWGSESNREAVLEDDARKKQFGALWNEDAIQQILETLDDTDWTFVQKIWTDIDSYWEDISLKDGSTIDGVKSLEMEQTGIAPPKVEASPFVVGERELPGGYYPLMYDNLSDARAHKETEQDLLNKLQSGGFTRAATSHGFTIARVGSGGRPVRLDLGVLYAHLDEVSQDLAYREAIQQAAEILGNNDVQEAIRATMGEPYRKSLEAILLATATGNMHSSDAAKDLPILRTARLNVTVGVMGFNVRSLLTQPLGLTQSIARIGAKEVGKGVAWLFANPTKINERIKSVNELSAYMADRAKTMTRELDDMTSKLGRESRLDKVRQFGYAPMVFLDVVTVAYPTWWGAFDSAMNGRAEGIDAGDEKSAILYADNIVRTTQGSGGAQNLSMVQQSSEAMKLLTMFYGYFNTTFNLQAEAYNRARADGSSLPRALLKRDFIGQTIMLQIIPAILAGLLLEKWPDEEELEEDATWAWTKWSLAQFVNHGGAQMAVVRDVASGITSPFGFSITAADSFGKAAVDVGKFTVKYIESQVDEDEEFELSPAAAKGLARSLGQLGGIPGTSQLVRTGDYLYKLSRDELKREPENVADLLQGALMLGDR